MKIKKENLTVESLSLEQQREAVLSELTSYQPAWSSYRTRVERTAGLDAELLASWETVNGHMSDLLEKFFILTAGVELKVVPTEEEALIELRRLDEQSRWAEYGQD